MPRGCLRDRPGSAEELWRAERPSGRCGPAGHRQHGLALEHPENLQKNWLWEFYQVILTFWTWCAVTGTLLLITDNIEYSCPATNECEITKCRQILPDLPLHEVFESGHAERSWCNKKKWEIIAVKTCFVLTKWPSKQVVDQELNKSGQIWNQLNYSTLVTSPETFDNFRISSVTNISIRR
ncbi:uncharacterized protein LOC143646853 isoform X1 [Tamandua tetradactyla]|uniref:uncharacterized protein LOC143646853 isoform X1 n=1 Tax=Tamandua tetradactyla TaxID=48850 RepID=UPI0040544B3B